jgi:hypothetical protein
LLIGAWMPTATAPPSAHVSLGRNEGCKLSNSQSKYSAEEEVPHCIEKGISYEIGEVEFFGIRADKY